MLHVFPASLFLPSPPPPLRDSLSKTAVCRDPTCRGCDAMQCKNQSKRSVNKKIIYKKRLNGPQSFCGMLCSRYPWIKSIFLVITEHWLFSSYANKQIDTKGVSAACCILKNVLRRVDPLNSHTKRTVGTEPYKL